MVLSFKRRLLRVQALNRGHLRTCRGLHSGGERRDRGTYQGVRELRADMCSSACGTVEKTRQRRRRTLFPLPPSSSARCHTNASSTPNVLGEKRRSERLPLSQPGNCQKRTNASCLRAACAVSVVLALYSHATLACQIVREIKQGQWTSTQVITAFIKSSMRAQDETNCITEGP